MNKKSKRGKHHLKMRASFLLRFSILILIWNFIEIKANPNESVAASQFYDAEKNDESKVDDRISKLESEVARLKTKGDEDGKLINQLMGRIERLEASKDSKKECSSDKVIERPKRPASFYPLQFPQETENVRFYGPPTSCDDLKKLGYDLNGYYLIKNQHQLNSAKVQVVFCHLMDIQANQNFQTLIGNVDLKTKNVQFYVQRKRPHRKKGVINFHIQRLNDGEALNLTTGVFTTPLNGTYHFQFSGIKSSDTDYLYVKLQVNGVIVGQTVFNDGDMKRVYSSASLTASLKLRAGDRVNLWKNEGQLYDTEGENFSHFTGWLVEEDIIMV